MDVFSRSFIVVSLALVMLAACASDGSGRDDSGVVALGKMRVTIGPGWQRVPDKDVPEKQGWLRVYSRDGLGTDRLILVPSVGPGDALFRDVNGTGVPVYQGGASDADIASFVAASLQAVLWDGGATIEASNVRPHGFTGIPGFLCDLEADVPSAANQRGMVGAFVYEDRLYVTVFLAEAPGAYERHREDAQAVVESMVMTMKTIRTAGL
jgi:hypothetical protein